jgi:para-nitrobenzyl esterase
MSAAAGTTAPTAAVRTQTGVVQGVSENGVIAYKGIPFAAPPLGGLRWQPPQSPKVWEGALQADKFKPQCMQLGPPLPTMPAEENSEDCLYLNLWRPATNSTSHLPVMVFLYGGGFRRGSASTPLYWGDEIARRKGVIVVNLAYRVGPLGFLAHPSLSAESPRHVSGNYGLLDMIAGLQWVRANIAAFGGDPKNVTVWGQSAGAWAINKLLISPPARGLFEKAIAESGGDMGPSGTKEGMASLSDAERNGIAFAEQLGAHSIAELRKLPAEAITASTFSDKPDGAVPIVDGYVIPSDTYDLYAAGQQARVPLLIGYNVDESQYMIEPVSQRQFQNEVETRYGTLAPRFLKLYRVETDAASARSQVQLASEATFGWHVWTWARLHAKTSRRSVYFYHFALIPGHGAELPFVFMHPFGGPWQSGQEQIADSVATYWANFARTGDPNGGDLPKWPACTDANGPVMNLGLSFSPAKMPDLPEHFLMDAYMNSLRVNY